MIPNPWVIIGFLVMLAVTGFTAYTKGHNSGVTETDAKWEKVELARKDIAQEKLTEATQRYITAEAKNTQQTQEWERKDNDRETYIHGLRIANGRLVAAAGGLFDRNGRSTGNSAGNAAGSAAGAAGEAAGAATGCRLSDGVTQDLLDYSARAARSEADAQLGHEYAEAVKAWRASHIPKLVTGDGHRRSDRQLH
jgi:hypothetical protein